MCRLTFTHFDWRSGTECDRLDLQLITPSLPLETKSKFCPDERAWKYTLLSPKPKATRSIQIIRDLG